jgi:phosphate transport system substrate-binding protein
VNGLVGLGGKGNEGVAALVKHTPGAMGYVDYVYAVQNQVPFGSVGNGVGKFIKANLTSLRAAAASLDERTTEFPVSITHAPGAEAYPMASFAWLLAPTHSRSKSEEEDLMAFLGWMLSGEPQNTASRLGYAPLPEGLRGRVYEEIRKIR